MQAILQQNNPLGELNTNRNPDADASGTRAEHLIATDLGISYETVVNTSSQLKLKLGVRSLPELMRKAVELLPGRV